MFWLFCPRNRLTKRLTSLQIWFLKPSSFLSYMITHLKSGRAGAELSANQINPWGLKNRIATISAEVHFKAQKESLVNREGYTNLYILHQTQLSKSRQSMHFTRCWLSLVSFRLLFITHLRSFMVLLTNSICLEI